MSEWEWEREREREHKINLKRHEIELLKQTRFNTLKAFKMEEHKLRQSSEKKQSSSKKSKSKDKS